MRPEDFEIDNTPPMSDTERRKFQRRLMRERRRQSRRQVRRSPWYTALLAVFLVIVAWFSAGALIGLEARRARIASVALNVSGTQTAVIEGTATRLANPSSEEATATAEYIVELATATGEARATETPTPTLTPTLTLTPTPTGGSSGQIAFITQETESPELAILDLASGERTILTDTPLFQEASPRWSPDGRWLAYTSNQAGDGRHIYLIDMQSAEREPFQLTQGIQVDSHPQWDENSESLFYRSVIGSRFFINRVTLDGEVETVIQLPSVEYLVDWLPDENLLIYFGFTVQSVLELQAFPVGEATSTARFAITEARGDIQHVDYAPDGEMVIFTATATEPARRVQIYEADPDCTVINAEDCVLRRITEDENSYFTPRFSPDGELLLVAANVEGNLDLYLMDLSGTLIRQLTDSPADDFDGVWSP